MAEQVENEEMVPAVEDEEPEETLGYKPPAPKSLDEIQALDAEDESLIKYKQTLLAVVDSSKQPFPDNPNNVIVSSMTLISGEREVVSFDLKGDISKLKDIKVVIKEGVKYHIRIGFYVQREIVSGLRYMQKISRKGIHVDNTKHMMGSYPPKLDEHFFNSPVDEAPSGLVARGQYKVKSRFVDDDKVTYLEWEWSFHIKKEWED